MITPISIDVYCNDSDGSPAYRVYVDDDLLTERTWSWPSFEIFVKEQLVVDIDPGFHKVRIENIGRNQSIYFNGVVLNGQTIAPTTGKFDSFAFTI
jgi:hypothetical protein